MNRKTISMKKLFSEGKNAVIVAIDHGEFDGPIQGMIDLPEAAKSITSEVDGVLLSPGMLNHCREIFSYRGAPIPIVRLNWSSVYCFKWKYDQAMTVPVINVVDAVASGAEIVLVSLTLHTGSEETDANNIKVFCKLVNEARTLGVPVIGECFPPNSDKLDSEELHNQVYITCRIISELGADLIKTFYTKNFAEVVNSCPIPILGLGGEKKPSEVESLKLAKNIVDSGAKGVVFGRNAIQSKNPTKFMSALSEVVKNSQDPVEMAKKYGLK